MTDKKIDILNRLSSTRESKWYELAQWRQSNATWLDKSAHIALKVLMKLRESDITKKEFAEAMDVSPQYISKLLKGHENMSLETICKMENILKITLIDIPFEFQTTTNYTCQNQSEDMFQHPCAYPNIAENDTCSSLEKESNTDVVQFA